MGDLRRNQDRGRVNDGKNKYSSVGTHLVTHLNGSKYGAGGMGGEEEEDEGVGMERDLTGFTSESNRKFPSKVRPPSSLASTNKATKSKQDQTTNYSKSQHAPQKTATRSTRVETEEKFNDITGKTRRKDHSTREAHGKSSGTGLLLQRASTLLLQRAPTLVRARSEFIREEVDIEEEQRKLGGKGGDEEDDSSSEEEYDTDLEPEGEVAGKDDVGLAIYEKTCRRLGVQPCSYIQRSLHLSQLSIKDRCLVPYEILALCNGLLENKTVGELCLDGNEVGPKGAGYLAMLLSDNRRIHTVSLADNKIGSHGAAVLTDMLLINQVITNINLSGNNFKDSEGEAFCDVITHNRRLTTLNLSHNMLGDKSASHLGTAIGNNETLRSLDLSWNHFRPVGAIELAKGIQSNIALRQFNVCMNGFSTAGAGALADALQINESLTELDLSYNRVYDEATIKLAQALLKNETLRVLNLSHNPLTSATAVALLTALTNNTASAMEMLNMSTIPLHEGAMPVLDAIEDCRPRFHFIGGGIVQSSRDYYKERDPRGGLREHDPIMMVMEYCSKKGLRMLEFFKQFDRDGGGSISREEFVVGLKMTGIPLSKSQLDDLIKMLDRDGDGEIDYSELIAGEKQYKKKVQMWRRKVKEENPGGKR